MEGKQAAAADSAVKGSRKPKNLDKNTELEVTEATGDQAVDEERVEESAIDSADADDDEHGTQAPPPSRTPAPSAATHTAKQVPAAPHEVERREKSMAERMRFKRRVRRAVR